MKKNYSLVLLLAISVTASANNPYINKVYDFCPAPGQFVNVMPEYDDGDTKDDILLKVEEQICGNEIDGANPGMISLGAYGGYVVFGFDHSVVNVPGEYDFKIYGNAFKANNSTTGGSCEPGIVMVSRDTNNDGYPNDEWYELAGSEYFNAATVHKYSITYYRPDADRAANVDPDPNYQYINDRTYIKWEDNTPAEGYVMRNVYHSQSYWPEWLDDATLTFEGALLPANSHDSSGTGTNYVQSFYDWGYADNQPNATDPGFKIDWAVDADGNTVQLESIDFVKVYSAINQYCGWIGETSTEVCGAEDLHPDAQSTSVDNIIVDNTVAEYYNLQGVKIETPSRGIYIKKQGNKIEKIVIQ